MTLKGKGAHFCPIKASNSYNFCLDLCPILCLYVQILRKWTQTDTKVYCWENLFKLLPERKFLTTKIFHFPLKIFVSSKIFEEFAIFEDLRRIFELTKILRIRLRSILRNRRIFVFVFGPFSIFVATLKWTLLKICIVPTLASN